MRKTILAFLCLLVAAVFTYVLTNGLSTNAVSLSLPEIEFKDRNQTLNDFNLGIANEAKLIEALKGRGEIPQDATFEESYAFLKNYLSKVAKNYTVQDNNDLENLAIENEFSKNINGRKIGQIQNTQNVAWDGSVRTDRILVILIEFADYQHNNITPFETAMYYPEYTKEHYQDMIFGEDGYVGPNGERFMSMKEYYEEQSGGSYTIEGEIAGWYQASNTAAYYGAPLGTSHDSRTRNLAFEALIQVASDPTVDLKDYDIEDPYDLNGNGNLREPDGIIDHVMIIHSGVGEEAGGGALGENAIWSHRWNLAGAGKVVKIPGSSANVGYWGGAMTAMNYTMEPEDGAMGVFAHEYGHDLGLPDEYDIIYSGAGEPVSYWSIMAGGSWAGAIGGTEPTSFSPYAKEYLQATMPESRWLDVKEINLDQITPNGIQVNLDQATSKGENFDAVKINLPSTKTVNVPAKGEYQYFSGYGMDLFNMMYTPVDLRKANTATLNVDIWYRIEEGWDYGYVLAFDNSGNLLGTIEGNVTTNTNPNGANLGHGITGFSYGWENATFDLSAFAGKQIILAFVYITDSYEAEYGMYLDNIEIKANNKPILSDGAENAPKFYLDGFSKVEEGTVETDHYYLVEWRNHQGSDAGLAHIDVGGATFLNFEPGMLVWYVDNYYAYNLVGLTPGNGFLGVVDADQNPVKRSDGRIFPMTALHIHDAAFTMDRESEFFWDFGSIQYFDDSTLAKRVFDDSNNYTNPYLRDAGRNIPMNYGIRIRVAGQSDDRSVGSIVISKN